MEKIIQKYGIPALSVITLLLVIVPSIQGLRGDLKGSTEVFLQASYILFLLVFVAIIAGAVFSFISDPQASAKSGIGLAGIVVLGFIAFGVSNNDMNKVYEKMKINPFISQFSESTLVLSYWLFLIVVIAIVVTEVINAVRS